MDEQIILPTQRHHLLTPLGLLGDVQLALPAFS